MLRDGVATTTFPVMVHAKFDSFGLPGIGALLASRLATLGFAHTGLMPCFLWFHRLLSVPFPCDVFRWIMRFGMIHISDGMWGYCWFVVCIFDAVSVCCSCCFGTWFKKPLLFGPSPYALSEAQVGSSLLVRHFVRPVPGLSGCGLLRGGVA